MTDIEHRDANLSEYLEVLVTDRLEKRILDRENKRFRSLYIVFGVVTAIGLGVFLNQIGVSADSAVEKRVGKIIDETEISRKYTNLLLLGTQLDVKDSFSVAQRDSATRLAIELYNNPKISTDETYISIVESIVDALYASGNNANILQICTSSPGLCTKNKDIAITVAQALFGEVISSPPLNGGQVDQIRQILNSVIMTLQSGSRDYAGVATAYKLILEDYDGANPSYVRDKLTSVMSSEDDFKAEFIKTLRVLLDRNSSTAHPDQKIINAEVATKKFILKYSDQIEDIGLTPKDFEEATPSGKTRGSAPLEAGSPPPP